MSDEAPLHTDLAEAPEGGRAFWIDAAGRKVRAAVWGGGARGTVLLFSGRTEYIEKYGRVIGELTTRGFSVATLDWRGQGLSSRALDDPMKGHVEDFAEFQQDLRAFLAAPEVAALGGPQVLVCHSMGGCIGMRALVAGAVSPAATVMSAPMLGIKLGAPTRLIARGAIGLSRLFGFQSTYAPAPKANQPYVLSQDFEGNLLTGDAAHYDWMRSHLAAEPGFGLGAPTLRWMGQAFDEMNALAAAPAPAGPMLMLLGDDEDIVDPAAIRAHGPKSPDCRIVDLPDARHEGFMETPEIRARIWKEIDAFLSGAGV